MADRTCNFDSCERKHYAKGWCYKHYLRVRRTGSPADPRPRAKQYCKIESCRAERKRGSALGFCGKHYLRFKKYGDPHRVPDRPLVVGVGQCTIDGCEGIIQARGWCSAHWSRWKRHGHPLARVRAEVVDGKRICPACEIDKPLEMWHPVYSYCRECVRVISRRRSAERRARLFEVEYEHVDIGVLLERDSRVCGICGCPILDLRHPDPMSPSVDHVVPISRGGAHTYANTQSAHLICNIKKRDRLPS